MKTWPNGLGATGSLYGTKAPLSVCGDVWFVDYDTGTDAASPRGLNEKAPLKTLTRAIANAASGDIIVLSSTHKESITNNNPLTMAKRLTILGSGRSAGIPCPEITFNYPSAPLGAAWVMGASECKGSVISNVRFLTGSNVEAADVGMNIAVEGITLHACQFDVKTFKMLSIGGAQGGLVQGCSFVNVEPTAPGGLAVLMNGTGFWRFVEPVFDAGAVGWELGIAMDALTEGPQSPLYLEDVTLLRGSDISVHNLTTGQYNVSVASGEGRVIW